MTVFAVNDNKRLASAKTFLLKPFIVSFLYASLKLEHDGTRGVNDRYVVSRRCLIRLRRLPMGSKEDFHVVKPFQIGMSDCLQPFLF